MTTAGVIVAVNHTSPTQAPPMIPVGNPLRGIQFDATGNPIPYVYGDYPNNTFQVGGSGFSRYETTNPRTPVERYSFLAHLDFELTDTTNLFFEASIGNVESYNLGAARWFNAQFSAIIRPDNPFIPTAIRQILTANPTITSFRVGKHWDDWGRVESHSDNDVYRMVVGANGELGDKWSWDTYYQLAYDSRHQYLLRQPINTNSFRALDATTNPANGQPICRDLLSPNPAVVAAAAGCAPLNPFGINQWSPAARDYVLGTLHEWYKMNEYVVAGNLQGDIGSSRAVRSASLPGSSTAVTTAR